MAKGQITDQELATGLKSFGGFGALGQSGGRPRREDPFRDTRSEATPPVTSEKSEAPRIEVVKTAPVEPPPIVDIEAEPKTVLQEEKTVPLKPRREIEPKKPVVMRPERGGETKRKELASKPDVERKAEIYTERVTVPLDAELRDGAEALAKELNRRRTDKSERITANTVMRVALRAMLERFDCGVANPVNTEEELQHALSKQLLRK